jgi:UDP-N-acetyl-2-amino-2-deoxyglucuronate dehydrogenase
MRLAVVGIDHFHSTGWVESIEQFSNQIEIVALYDSNEAIGQTLAPVDHDPRLSASLKPSYRNLAFYSDLDALLATHPVDLALVTLPNKEAPAAIERLALAGVHLIVDKPGARTANEARHAFEVARSTGVKVAIGFTKRYATAWRDARLLVESGRLGRLHSAEAMLVSSSVSVRNPSNYLFNHEISGGGVLHWLGIHDIDALEWLTGDRIVEVNAMTVNASGEQIDVEDLIALALRFSDGAIATLHYAYALPRPGSDGYVALRGSGGSLKLSPGAWGKESWLEWIGPGTVSEPVVAQRTTYTNRDVPGYGTGALSLIADLLAAIREDRDPVATDRHAVRALELIDAAYHSARTGQRVRL